MSAREIQLQAEERSRLDERYVLEESLGRGATSTVWRARDRVSGGHVCVKQLRPELASDPAAFERLRAEAECVTRLSHPSILPLLEARLDSSAPRLVFPYVEGETLASRLARQGRLETGEAARITRQVADALAAAHVAGVVHRDVKPSNILLGTDGRARLLDFGIADAGAALSSPQSAGSERVAIGTPPYIAPEQLTAEPATPANDVFALGAVLYEMLAGSPPYRSRDPGELAHEQAFRPPEIVDAPQPLVAIALAALAYEPSARPTAAALRASLDGWINAGIAVDAATVTFTPAARPRRRVLGGALPLVGSAPLVVGALLATLLVATLAALAFAPRLDVPGTGPAIPAQTPAAPASVPVQEPTPDPAIVTTEQGPPEDDGAESQPEPATRGGDDEGEPEPQDDQRGGDGNGDEKGKGDDKGNGDERGKGNDKGNGRGD